MTTRERWQALSQRLDEAVAGLTAFDAEGLERLERELRSLTAECRSQGLTESREVLAEVLQKHTLLQAMLKATAANLKVMDTRRTNAQNRRDETDGYLNFPAEPVPQRPDGRREGAERNRK